MSSFTVDIDSIHMPGFAEFHLYEEVLLAEEGTVIKSDESRKIIKYSFGIEVDGSGSTDRGFGKDPYFKIYDGKSIFAANHITRIAIFRPEYIIHKGQKWLMSSNEKKNLMTLLAHHVKHKDKTIWQLILDECVSESTMYDKGFTDDDKERILTAPLPDYTKLK